MSRPVMPKWKNNPDDMPNVIWATFDWEMSWSCEPKIEGEVKYYRADILPTLGLDAMEVETVRILAEQKVTEAREILATANKKLAEAETKLGADNGHVAALCEYVSILSEAGTNLTDWIGADNGSMEHFYAWMNRKSEALEYVSKVKEERGEF